jgi:uncharacterized phage protein (TIGR02218 family)
MVQIVNPKALAHWQQESTRITVAGYVQKANGDIIRCTQFDDDLTILTGALAGTYLSTASITASDIKSSSDMSADNLEVTGAMASSDFGIVGFDVQDIVAGQFRNAPFEIFLCQWDEPSAWQRIIHRGYLGQITRSAEGSFTAEWRGLLQVLSQNVGRVYSDTCDVKRFCDARCKLNIADFTFPGEVSSVASRKMFTVALGSPDHPIGTFQAGELQFTQGRNVGYLKQIKRDATGGTVGQIELWEAMPFDIEVGDSCTLAAGCDRRFETCQKYGNQINFRGDGHWIPGIPKIIRAPS